MAIFHLSPTIHTRGKGHSAVNGAAYRGRCEITDERTGKVHNYSNHSPGSVLFEGIYAPKDAPAWAQDRAQLWNHVEAFETRKDAQLCRTFTIALMHELSPEENRRALQDWTRENFTRKGLIADVVIHAPDKHGDDRNIHAHVAVVLRKLDGPEFAANKERTHSKAEKDGQLLDWKISWEKHANRHLERAGLDVRIDHRSHKDRGLEQEPGIHLGAAAALERRGIKTDRGDISRAIKERNAQMPKQLRGLETRAILIEAEIAAAEQRAEPSVIRMYRGIGNNVWEARQGEAVFFTTDRTRAAAFGQLHYVDVTPAELAKFERPHSARILAAEPSAANDYRTADPAIIARLKPVEVKRANGQRGGDQPDIQTKRQEPHQKAVAPEAIKGAAPQPEAVSAPRNGSVENIREVVATLKNGTDFAAALSARGLILAEVRASDLPPKTPRDEYAELLQAKKQGAWIMQSGGTVAFTPEQHESARASYEKWSERAVAFPDRSPQRSPFDYEAYVSFIQEWQQDRLAGLEARAATFEETETRKAVSGPRLSEHAKEGDLVAFNDRGFAYAINTRTTGLQRDELETFKESISRRQLLSASEGHQVALNTSRIAWLDEMRADHERRRPASWIEQRIGDCATQAREQGAQVVVDVEVGWHATPSEALADRLNGDPDNRRTQSKTIHGAPAFHARLQQAEITIARVTAADVIALKALRHDEDMARQVAHTNNQAYKPRHFAELAEGDLAAVTRNGVQRINLEKLGDAKPHLTGDLPSVGGVRANREIEDEKKAAVWEQRRARSDEDRAAFGQKAGRQAAIRKIGKTAKGIAREADKEVSGTLGRIGKLLGGILKAAEAALDMFDGGDPILSRPEQKRHEQSAKEKRVETVAERITAQKKADLDHLLRQSARGTAERQLRQNRGEEFGHERELKREL